MTAPAGGMAVTVRRDRRSPNVWAVHGPTARRIGEVRPAGGSTACWLAIARDGGIHGRGSTFGAALGLLVDAAIGTVGTRRRQPAVGRADDAG